MSSASAYRQRQNDPVFAARWIEALQAGYARLELLLLDQALNGFARTETVTDGDGAVKQIKTVRSFPHGVAMRLFQSHGEAVLRYRAMAAGRDGESEAATAAGIRAELDRVRARLADAAAPADMLPVEDEGADADA